MTVLDELVEPFKREVALPGTFATRYPATTDDDIAASLADSFAQAQLDTWFAANTIDVNTNTVTPDLSTAGQALVVIYAGIRWIRAELRTTQSNVTYKAGSVEYAASTGVSLLAELLKELQARQASLYALARAGSRTTYAFDGYYGRLWFDLIFPLGPWRAGFLAAEIPMVPALAYGY